MSDPDFAAEAYRACLEGRADAQQQRSAAAQIALLHGLKGELRDELQKTALYLGSVFLVTDDREVHRRALERVECAREVIAKAGSAA